MPTGKLGAVNIPTPSVDTLLYAVPSAKTAVFSLCLVNRGLANVAIRIALTTGASVTDADYIAYDAIIYPKESYERNGIVLTYGQCVYIRTDIATVNAVVWGYEDDA